ncbi:MAG: nitroreductase/quinone reductase family protein [Pseudomonadales bacterium]
MTEMKNFNEKIIEEFRANNGQVAMFADYPMIILHTVGSKSGKTFLVPLVLTIEDGEMLLFASFAGAKKHPAWVSNLRANPAITVEVGDESFAARVVELAEAEAKSTVQRQADASEQFAKYVESAAPRDIPVFRIERV